MNLKERDHESIIINWLRFHGFNPYLNRFDSELKNTCVFHTKGSYRKPDIIFQTKNFGWIAIEVKRSSDRRDIGDARKIINYWDDIVENNITYYVDENEVKIAGLVVATKNSLFGFLKDNETDFKLQDYARHPKKEYLFTKEYVRSIFDIMRERKKRGDLPEKEVPLWGILVSSLLNHDSKGKPLLFCQEWIFDNNTQKKIIFMNCEELMPL